MEVGGAGAWDDNDRMAVECLPWEGAAAHMES